MSNRLLIGCEESQAVCVEMRKRGVDAYSCDVIDCCGRKICWFQGIEDEKFFV